MNRIEADRIISLIEAMVDSPIPPPGIPLPPSQPLSPNVPHAVAPDPQPSTPPTFEMNTIPLADLTARERAWLRLAYEQIAPVYLRANQRPMRDFRLEIIEPPKGVSVFEQMQELTHVLVDGAEKDSEVVAHYVDLVKRVSPQNPWTRPEGVSTNLLMLVKTWADNNNLIGLLTYKP